MYDNDCKDICFNEGESKFQVQLPFQDDHNLLSDNYEHCKTQSKKLPKKLSLNADSLDACNSIIKSQLWF